jgi:hypothetical protein
MYIVYQYITNTCVKIIYGLRVAHTRTQGLTFYFFSTFSHHFPNLLVFNTLSKPQNQKC